MASSPSFSSAYMLSSPNDSGVGIDGGVVHVHRHLRDHRRRGARPPQLHAERVRPVGLGARVPGVLVGRLRHLGVAVLPVDVELDPVSRETVQGGAHRERAAHRLTFAQAFDGGEREVPVPVVRRAVAAAFGAGAVRSCRSRLTVAESVSPRSARHGCVGGASRSGDHGAGSLGGIGVVGSHVRTRERERIYRHVGEVAREESRRSRPLRRPPRSAPRLHSAELSSPWSRPARRSRTGASWRRRSSRRRSSISRAAGRARSRWLELCPPLQRSKPRPVFGKPDAGARSRAGDRFLARDQEAVRAVNPFRARPQLERVGVGSGARRPHRARSPRRSAPSKAAPVPPCPTSGPLVAAACAPT